MNWDDFVNGYVCGCVLTMILIMIGLPWMVKEEEQ